MSGLNLGPDDNCYYCYRPLAPLAPPVDTRVLDDDDIIGWSDWEAQLDYKVECSNCNDLVPWRVPFCPGCRTILEEEFWDDWEESLWDELQDTRGEEEFGTTLSNNIQLAYKHYEVDDLLYDINYCCNKNCYECTCNNSDVVSWEDIKQIPIEVDEDAYSTDGPCSKCRYFFTPGCAAYIQRSLAFIRDKKIMGTIDGCGDFVPYFSYNAEESIND